MNVHLMTTICLESLKATKEVKSFKLTEERINRRDVQIRAEYRKIF